MNLRHFSRLIISFSCFICMSATASANELASQVCSETKENKSICTQAVDQAMSAASSETEVRLKQADKLANVTATQSGASNTNVTLLAEKGASRVSLRLSVLPALWDTRMSSSVKETPNGKAVFISYDPQRWAHSLAISTPVAKSGDSIIAAASRLQTGTAIEWKSGWRKSEPNNLTLLAPLALKQQRACREMLVQLDEDRKNNAFSAYLDKREKLKEYKDMVVGVCDQPLLKMLYDDWSNERDEKRRRSYDIYKKFLEATSSFYRESESKAPGVWGFDIAGTLNYDDFSYVNSSNLSKLTTERKHGRGLSATALYANPVHGYQASLTAEFADTYKANKLGVLCPLPAAGATAPLVCQQGALGTPAHSRGSTLSIDLRRAFDLVGIGFVISRDLKAKRNDIEVPVYLVPNEKSALIAGLKFGWNSEDKKGAVSVFVGAPFGLLN